MKNLEEKLDLSRHLYEQGLEPDMQFSYNHVMSLTEGSITGDDWRIEPTKVFKSKVNLSEYLIQPWFSLERVLALLPDKIEASMLIKEYVDYCCFFLDTDDIGYRHEHANEVPLYSSLHEDTNIDYHLSAIRLLKKVIEICGVEVVA